MLKIVLLSLLALAVAASAAVVFLVIKEVVKFTMNDFYDMDEPYDEF